MKLSTSLTKVLYGILAFITGYYYYVHLKHAINFPVNDEYRTISTVMVDYLRAPGFWDKLKVLLVNENESLQLFLKLTNIFFYHVTGEVRYDFLGYIGQFILLGFPLAVYRMNRNSETLWFDLGMTILVIFNLQYYVLSFRHDTAFYYHVGLFGVLFSVYFWVQKKFGAAVLFFLLGIFNNTSSVLVLPVFVLDYIVSSTRIRKKYLVAGSVGFLGVLAVFYFLNPYLFYLPEGLAVTVKAFLILLGNLVEFRFGIVSEKPYLVIGALNLVFILCSFIYYFFFYKQKSKKGQFYALLALYFFVSLVAIALKRSFLYHYLSNLLDHRYKMFSFPLLLFLLLLWNEMKSVKPWLKGAVLVAFLGYNVLCAFRAQDLVRFYDQAIRLNSVSVPRGYDMMGPVHINFAVRIYGELDSLGLAPLTDPGAARLYDHMRSVKLDGSEPVWQADVDVSRIFDSGRYHTIQRVIGESDRRASWLFLKSDEHTFLFPIDFYYPRSFPDFVRHLDYCNEQFQSAMFLSVLEKGAYHFGLVSEEKDGSYRIRVHPQKTVIDDKALNLVDEFPELPDTGGK